MKKTYLTLLAIMLFFSVSMGQLPDRRTFDVKTAIATSPDAAILGRFGDIPIGHYTGTADVSVPLYTIKEAGLEIPIVLRYHGSGIKVQDEAGWVGLGWSMEPAGSIIQSVNGREDEMDQLADFSLDGYDFLKDGMLLGSYSSKYTDNRSTALLRAIGYGEGQPDYYYFYFPGGSGKFYINPENNEIVQIDKKNNLFIVKNSPDSWTITTLDGNKYIFNVKEVAAGYSVSDISGYTWRLTKIQLYTGREINFEYSDGYYESYSKSQTWHDPYAFNYDNGGLKEYINAAVHRVKYLKSISSPSVRIDFELEDRDDLFNQPDNDGISGNGSLSSKRVKAIVVKDPNTLVPVKSFGFNYSYFGYSTVGGNFMIGSSDYDKLGKRLKLEQIREYGYDNLGNLQPLTPYTFAYEESTLLPLKTSYATDFWGYYNGKNNSTFLPDLSYYLYSGYPEYQSIPSYVLSSYGTGANKSVNTSVVQAGILKRINYPTGGYSVFDYESNSFSNYNYPDVDQISASTVNQSVEDKNNTNDIHSKQFSIPNSLTVHFVASLNRGPNTNVTFADMLPSTVTLTRIGAGGSNITPIKTWQMQSTQAYGQDFAADGFVTWTEDIALEYVPNTYYVVSASLPNALGPQNSSTNSASVSCQYSFSYMTNTTATKSYGAGIRIKSIKNYSSEGMIATQKNFSYSQNGLSSGILMSPLKHFFSSMMYFQKVTFEVPKCYVENENKTIWFVSADGYMPFSDAAAGNAVGYSKVTEEDISGASNNGFHNLYFHNFQSNTKLNNPAIPDLRNGLMLKEDYLTVNADTVKKIIYNYTEKEAKFFRGFKIYENFVGYEAALEGTACTRFPVNMHYTMDSYPNNAQWFLLDRQTSWDYFSGQTVKKDQFFTYNTNGQLTAEKTWDSNGREIVDHTVYLTDAPPSTESYDLLNYYSLFNSIIEKYKTIDNVEVEHVKNHYSSVNGMSPNLTMSESSFGDSNFQEDFSVEYGDFKTPISIKQKGTNTALIWSFNSLYLVAKIDNGELSTIRNILGAENLINFTRVALPSDSQITSFLSPLRSSALPNSFITTYKHRPTFGLSSETDVRGLKTFYNYDAFQRLNLVIDDNQNIIKATDYHYKN